MEKYGFIYLWYDRKRKMYYLGSHWGRENDGYICSSNRMRDAYRRRPQDFRRRVVQSNIKREDLLEVEYKWLQMINEQELGKKYYNLRQHKWGHWSSDVDSRDTVGQKISKSHIGKKRKPFSEETRRKLREARARQASPSLGKRMSEETKQKLRKPKPPRSDEHKANMSKAKKGSIPWNKGKVLKPESTNYSTIYMRTYNK